MKAPWLGTADAFPHFSIPFLAPFELLCFGNFIVSQLWYKKNEEVWLWGHQARPFSQGRVRLGSAWPASSVRGEVWGLPWSGSGCGWWTNPCRWGHPPREASGPPGATLPGRASDSVGSQRAPVTLRAQLCSGQPRKAKVSPSKRK